MPSSFLGIETARRALQAQMLALQTASHNIANAATPGYSRQTVRLVSGTPFPVAVADPVMGTGQVGTGVLAADIQRVHDEFVRQRLDEQAQLSGYWSAREGFLDKVELAMLEPSEAGINHSLDLFWQSLQDLAQNPEAHGVRAVVVQRAEALVSAFRHVRGSLDPLRRDLDAEVRTRVQQVNALARQIANLNDEIASVTTAGQSPNDLLDRRDAAIHQLARLVNVQVVERPSQMVAVVVEGVALVDARYHREVEAIPRPGDGFVELRWQDSQLPVGVTGGELRALLEGRDEVVPRFIQQVDELARTFLTEFNVRHAAGFDLTGAPGGLFFTGNDAATIDVAPPVKADLNKVAASGNGLPGDGTNALRLAEIKHLRLMRDGSTTPTDFYASVISELGALSQQAKKMVENQEVVEGHLESLRESISGVSLDEEMSHLVQFQHAYAAAARALTVVDEILDLVINRMGLAGR